MTDYIAFEYSPHHFERKTPIGTLCPVFLSWLQQLEHKTQPSVSQPFYFWYSGSSTKKYTIIYKIT